MDETITIVDIATASDKIALFMIMVIIWQFNNVVSNVRNSGLKLIESWQASKQSEFKTYSEIAEIVSESVRGLTVVLSKLELGNRGSQNEEP